MVHSECSVWTLICSECFLYSYESVAFRPIELGVLTKLVKEFGWYQHVLKIDGKLYVAQLCPVCEAKKEK